MKQTLKPTYNIIQEYDFGHESVTNAKWLVQNCAQIHSLMIKALMEEDNKFFSKRLQDSSRKVDSELCEFSNSF